jgi:hypothetical protein
MDVTEYSEGDEPSLEATAFRHPCLNGDWKIHARWSSSYKNLGWKLAFVLLVTHRTGQSSQRNREDSSELP